MKKIYLLIVSAVILGFSTNAQVVFQSDFSSWNNGIPTDWFGSKTSLEIDSISEVTSGAVYGSSSAQLINLEESHRRLTTQQLQVTGGQGYEIKFWVKGTGEIRTALFDTTYGAYNSYISVNVTDWEMYSQTLTANASSDSAEFILSFRNTGNDFVIDSVSIEEVTITIPEVSVYDIQYTTDASGDSPYTDQTVNTHGVVTAVLSSGYFIQSGNGPWSGIYVYDSNNAGNVNIGDSITFTALVVEYYNMTELKNVSNFNIVANGVDITATQLATGDISQEMYEACYVKAVNATCTDPDLGYGEWQIDDNSGACRVDDKIFAYTPNLNDVYNVTGVLDYSYGNFKILPRSANDIVLVTGINDVNNSNVEIYPNPVRNTLNIRTDNTNNKVSISDITGKTIFNTISKSSVLNIDMSNYKNGVYFVKVNIAVYKIVKR